MRGTIIGVLATAWLATLTSAQNILPHADEQASGTTYVSAAQQAFGISPTDADILTPLANVIAAFDPTEPVRDQALPNVPAVAALVDALNAGAAPGAYSDEMFKLIDLSPRSAMLHDTGWKYGNHAHISAIAWKLFERAKRLEAHDPEGAVKTARAAVLLAAHGNFSLTHGDITQLTQDPRFQDLVGLSDEAHGAFLQFVDERAEDERRFFLALTELYRVRKQILAVQPGEAIGDETSQALIDSLCNAWESRHTNPDAALRFCLLARSTVLALRDAGERDLERRIVAHIASWQRSEMTEPAKQWLHEVTEVRSPLGN